MMVKFERDSEQLRSRCVRSEMKGTMIRKKLVEQFIFGQTFELFSKNKRWKMNREGLVINNAHLLSMKDFVQRCLNTNTLRIVIHQSGYPTEYSAGLLMALWIRVVPVL